MENRRKKKEKNEDDRVGGLRNDVANIAHYCTFHNFFEGQRPESPKLHNCFEGSFLSRQSCYSRAQ
jgi:hypothetical protein